MFDWKDRKDCLLAAYIHGVIDGDKFAEMMAAEVKR